MQPATHAQWGWKFCGDRRRLHCDGDDLRSLDSSYRDLVEATSRAAFSMSAATSCGFETYSE